MRELNIEDLKSCANCAFADRHVYIHGFAVVNNHCNLGNNLCENFCTWEFDGLTQYQRYKQDVLRDWQK